MYLAVSLQLQRSLSYREGQLLKSALSIQAIVPGGKLAWLKRCQIVRPVTYLLVFVPPVLPIHCDICCF